MAGGQPLETRFWAKVERCGPDECWPWQGYRNDQGYGYIINGRGRIRVHRLSWQLANARLIPQGGLVCHSCDNRACVNPAHLWVGSVTDNNHDRDRKGRHANARKTHCKRGHALSGANIYFWGPRGTERKCRTCRTENNRKQRQRRAERSVA